MIFTKIDLETTSQMGIYNFFLGKGIILPLKFLIQKYLPVLINSDYDELSLFHEHEEVFQDIVQDQLAPQCKIILLGHDALTRRHGDIQAFDGTLNRDAYEEIKKWQKQKESLAFIGICRELRGGEFIYSLPEFLPEIVEYYPQFIKEELNFLKQEFPHTVCIWTFTSDCCCT